MDGIKTEAPDLSPAEISAAAALGVDTSVMYEVTGPEGTMYRLPVPGRSTWRIGVFYDSGPTGSAGTASRASVVVNQQKLVIGGSTYILRRAAAH